MKHSAMTMKTGTAFLPNRYLHVELCKRFQLMMVGEGKE